MLGSNLFSQIWLIVQAKLVDDIIYSCTAALKTWGVISFAATDLYQQSIDICKIARNVFGKYLFFIREHFLAVLSLQNIF